MASSAELAIIISAKDGASKAIDGLGKSLGGLGGAGKAATAALAAVTTIGATLVAGIGHAVGVATDFEHAMSAVGAVSGASSSELAGLSQTALALGQDVTLAGISASDAASAMAELASGGISVADIMGGAARGALLLASAGGIGVARAAEIAAAALKNFGLAGDQAGHIADIFAAASNSSAVTVDDLGESMKYIGPIANSMGLKIEEVTAALAELGDQGIKGTQAGTSLRSILASIAKPSKEAAATIQDLGLQFFDSSGKMKSLAGISGELHDKLAGLTDQQRANALVTLFSNEALSAATVLYGEGADGIAKYLAQVNVAGAAAANGAKRNDNLRGSIEQLKSSIETAEIALGTAFIPVLRKLADGAAAAVSAAIPFIQAWGPKLVSALTTGVAAVAGFGRAVGGAVGAVVDAIGKLASGQITFAQFIGGMEVFVATILGKFGELAAKIGPPLAAFFAAIGTFIVGAAPQILAQMGLWAASFVDWIATTAIPFLAPRLAAFLQAVVGWITGTALPAIGAAALALGSALADWVVGTAIPFVTTNLPLWKDAIVGWITDTGLPAIGAALVTVGTAFGDWVATKAVPWVVENLPGWWAAIADWITGTAIPAATATLVGLGTALGDWIGTSAIPAITTNMPIWVNTILSWVENAKTKATDEAPKLANALADWIKDNATPQTRTNMEGWVAAISTGLDNANTAIDTHSGPLAEGLAGWIEKEANPKALAGMARWLTIIEAGLLGALPLVLLATKPIAEAMWDWVQNISTPKMATGLAQFFNTIDTILLKLLFAVPILTFKVGVALVRGLIEGHESQIGFFEDIVALIPQLALAAVGNTLGTLFQKGADLVQGFISGINSKIGEAIAAAGKLAGLIGGGIGDALGIHSPSTVTMEFGRQIVNGLIVGIDEKQDEAIKKAADLASSVAKAIQDTLAALKALSSFDVARNTPSAGQIGGVTAFIANMTAIIAEVAAQFSDKALKAASEFSDAAGKVVGLIGNGVKALTDLGKFVPPATAAIYAFGKSLRAIVNDFAVLAEQITKEMYTEAADFADSAGKVVAIIGNGVAGFTALAKFVAPPAAAIYAFGKTLRAVVNDFAVLSEQITADMYTEAAAFADGAGKVVAILGNGVAGFLALESFTAPGVAAIYAFGKTLRAVINDFALLAEQITQDATDQAAKFAEGAGKVVAIIGGAVDGLSKLADFVAPSQEAIDNFVYAVYETVRKIGEMAAQMSADGITLAGAFGTAAGSVFNALKTALDVFTGLAKLVVPSAQAIDNFGIAVAYTVRRIGDFADQIGKDGIKHAQDFGTAIGGIFGALKSAIDILTGLEKFPDLAKKAMDAFFKGVQAVVARMAEATDQAGEFAKQAAGYKAQILAGVADVKAAQQALNTIGGIGGAPDLKNIGQGLADSVIAGVTDTLETHSPSQVMAAIGRDVVAGLVQGMSDAEQDALSKAAQVAGNVADAVSKALDAFSRLTTFAAPPVAAIYAFGKTLKAAINDFALIAEQVTTEASDLAGKFAEGAGKAVQVFGNGIDGFLKLKDYVAPAPAAIYAFGKTLRLVIADLAIVAEQVTVDSADLAGKFADGAGKAIAVIGGGIESFLKLVDYVAPAPAAVESFLDGVKQVVERLAGAATLIGDKPLAQALAFGDAAGSIFKALKDGLDLLITIDKPGNWPLTDWLQPLIELMAGVLSRGGVLLSQAQQLQAIAQAFADGIATSAALFQAGGALLANGFQLSGAVGGGTGTTIVNNTYISGNTLLSKDTATQQMVAGIVTTQQNKTIGYSI